MNINTKFNIGEKVTLDDCEGGIFDIIEIKLSEIGTSYLLRNRFTENIGFYQEGQISFLLKPDIFVFSEVKLVGNYIREEYTHYFNMGTFKQKSDDNIKLIFDSDCNFKGVEKI